jgi:mono/diheme cytochrome c family protein
MLLTRSEERSIDMSTHASLVTALLCALAAAGLAGVVRAADQDPVARGRYLMIVSGCHDCNTPGYLEGGGQVTESQWLTGNTIGYQGPWGTTYPANLRLSADGMTETQWLARTRQAMRPPMPWFNLRQADDADLRAMYRYLRAIGPAGEPAPPAAAPGIAVSTPYYDFTPKNLPQQAGN